MESIRLENIKSFSDTGKIEVKPITIFVGRNSSGKSSLLRFPAVLAQTAEADGDSPINFFGKKVDFGLYEDVLHRGSNGKITFELEYPINVNLPINPFIGRSSYMMNLFIEDYMGYKKDIRNIRIKVYLDNTDEKIVVDVIELYSDDTCLYQICRKKDNKYCFSVNYKYKDGEFVETHHTIDVDGIQFRKFLPKFEENKIAKSIYSSIFDEESFDQKKLDSLMEHVYKTKSLKRMSKKDKEFIEVWGMHAQMVLLLGCAYGRFDLEARYTRYIGPFRVDPSRYYRDQQYVSTDIGVHGENTSNILFHDSRIDGKQLLKRISKWTKDALGYEITLKNISSGLFQVMLKDDQGNETNLIDNGYGVSQVLPIVTEIVNLSINKEKDKRLSGKYDFMVLLEQPELHLHPAAQSELADLLVTGVTAGNGRKKILVETHSEHLIRKLQILVAEKDCPLTKDMVRIYYVDKDEKGDAHVEEMKLLDNGKFENLWPTGFFDRGYQLARELAEAGVQE